MEYSYNSKLTFSDLLFKDLKFVKIIWNNTVFYDDVNKTETIDHLNKMLRLLEDKIFYEAKLTVVDLHHYIIDITGEPITEKEVAILTNEEE